MPIYAYLCTSCGADEEHIQKLSDPPIAKCQTCGGRLEKVVTAASFHLKGGGWYKDGYASTRPEGGASSDSSAPESSSSQESSGADSANGGKDSGGDGKGGADGGTKASATPSSSVDA